MNTFEKIVAVAVVLAALSFGLKTQLDLERHKEREASHVYDYAMSRIIECEHQIAFLKDRVSALEASR